MRRSRRMLLTAAVTALLPAAALLSSGLTAPATGASLPTLAQAFNNVGITSAAHAAAGNYDGIGDSFSASGLAADALSPGRSLLHDGLHDHLAGRRARQAGQRRRRRPDGRGQPGPAPRSASSARPRTAARSGTVHRRLRRRHHQHRHGHVRRLDRHQRRRPGTDLLATTAGWNPGGTHPGQPVLRGDPADRGQAGRLGHAAHGRRERRQERLVDAHLQPDDRLARPGGGRRARRRLLLRRGPQGLRRHRRQRLVEGLVHGRGRRRCPTSTPRRSTTPTSRAWTRSSPAPASPRCSRAT